MMASTKSKPATAIESAGRKQHNQPVRQQYRVLDEAARNRRSRQFLEQLERDNFHEDPHANLVMHKKAPKFDDAAIKPSNLNGPGSGGGRKHTHRTRVLSFAAMVEEDAKMPEPNYSSAQAPSPSRVITLTERCCCRFRNDTSARLAASWRLILVLLVAFGIAR